MYYELATLTLPFGTAGTAASQQLSPGRHAGDHIHVWALAMSAKLNESCCALLMKRMRAIKARS